MKGSATTILMTQRTPMLVYMSVGVLGPGNTATDATAAAVGESCVANAAGTWATATRGPNAVLDPPVGTAGAAAAAARGESCV